VLVFIGFALTGVVPELHFFQQYGASALFQVVDVFHIVFVSAALYLVGAFVYVRRIPERWWPGAFDIWGHSHQFWHLFVFFAAVAHGLVRRRHWFRCN
jgi:adiponectin receptor